MSVVLPEPVFGPDAVTWVIASVALYCAVCCTLPGVVTVIGASFRSYWKVLVYGVLPTLLSIVAVTGPLEVVRESNRD